MHHHPRVRQVGKLLLGLLMCVGCAAPAQPASPVSPAPPAGAEPAASSATSLPTTPSVSLKAGTQATTNYAPFFIAQERGYFREVGLDVEFVETRSVNEALPSLSTGQLQVGTCASSVACFNAINRGTDLRIVADQQSGGKTEKSTGSAALVVRKDLWDSGAIREPKDLMGRSVYMVARGSGIQAQAGHWLRHQGLDPLGVEYPTMPFADQLAAFGNGAIEVGTQVEPLISVGLARGFFAVMATQEVMHPTTQVLYLTFWKGIDGLGSMVGERFLVAYLRAARDYLNAFEYGVDQDAIIDILIKETPVKDAALYRSIKYSWIDPNGSVSRSALEADAQLFRELGLIDTPIDLSSTFEDKYRQYAVQHLGEYLPPR